MSNQIETYRVEADESGCGSWYFFDWSTGHLRAEHDNGETENWPPRGYSIETKALSFMSLTDQWERYRQFAKENGFS